MKSIYETFTDSEFKKLIRAKGNTNWHDFIMELAQVLTKTRLDEYTKKTR